MRESHFALPPHREGMSLCIKKKTDAKRREAGRNVDPAAGRDRCSCALLYESDTERG